MSTLLDVMRDRLGVQEIPGQGHNQTILGWFEDVGHPEVKSDETSWCSVCLGSAAVRVGLPIPPPNINMLARSWLTWGVAVDPKDVQPGDVAIWPRGDPRGWQGHVNVVEEVLPSGKIKCIGGNQGGLAGGDAVTRTKALDPRHALGFRRAVPATVPALRAAGSSEIKAGDRLQNAGTIATIAAPIVAAAKEMWEPIAETPVFKSLPEGLTFWQHVLEGANACLKVVAAHPWLASALIFGLLMAWGGRALKKARVAKHAAGVPIAAEVARLEAA